MAASITTSLLGLSLVVLGTGLRICIILGEIKDELKKGNNA